MFAVLGGELLSIYDSGFERIEPPRPQAKGVQRWQVAEAFPSQKAIFAPTSSCSPVPEFLALQGAKKNAECAGLAWDKSFTPFACAKLGTLSEGLHTNSGCTGEACLLGYRHENAGFGYNFYRLYQTANTVTSCRTITLS